jgi:hypothetical protein
MNITLGDIIEVVDRSIEKSLYEALLSTGYTPNRETYNNIDDFKAQETAIKNSKGFIVRLYGAGSPDARDLKTLPRIVYDFLYYLPGNIGGNENIYILNTDNETYTVTRMPPKTTDIRFEITLTSKTSTQDRLLNAILANSVHDFSFIPFYNAPQYQFFVTHEYSITKPDIKGDFMEKVYTFQAHDLWQKPEALITSVLAKVKEIKIVRPDQTIFDLLKVNNTATHEVNYINESVVPIINTP